MEQNGARLSRERRRRYRRSIASPTRILVPNGIYHVFTCGTGPSAIFHDDLDHGHFNWSLATTVRNYGWRLLVWFHMATHVHLLVETPDANLDVGMQRTKSCFAREYNRKYDRRGALFDARYGYRVVTSDLQFFRTVRYIARNATEEGLCESPADWPWSSVAKILNGLNPWPANGSHELVRRCGGVESLRRLVEEGLGDELDYLPSLQPQRL